MNSLKIVFLLGLIFMSFQVNAQDIKFKKGSVLIDGTECFKFENETSTMTTLFDLNSDEVLTFEYVKVTSYDPKNAAGFNVHFDVYFTKSDVRSDLKFNSRKKFIEALVKSKVIKDCSIDSEKLESFINKYSLQ